MPKKIAINGYGRIGRNILRALYESKRQDLQIVTINDLGDLKTHAYLTKYDSTHGIAPFSVTSNDEQLVIDNDHISLFQEPDPRQLPWDKLDIDVVLECTGQFAGNHADAHLVAGAKKILISAPAGNLPTVVYGVNHTKLQANDKMVSNASCTTNCLAPCVLPLHNELGIESGLMTTIHAYTNDQALVDVYHSDMRRARSATASMIPTKTGAAAAIGMVIPELQGKLDGFAIRVPTMNVSVVDLTIQITRQTTVDEVNDILQKAADGPLREVVAVNKLPLVSIDFNHNGASSVFDLTQTRVLGSLVKVLTWYDNEWGFSNRMLDTAAYMANLSNA